MSAAADRYFAGWNAHDADAVAAAFSPTGLWRDIGGSFVLHGRAAIRDAAAGYIDALGDLHVTVARKIRQGEHVACEWHATAVHAAPLWGFQPAGRTVEFYGCTVFRVGPSGLIETDTNYWDVNGLRQQLTEGEESTSPAS